MKKRIIYFPLPPILIHVFKISYWSLLSKPSAHTFKILVFYLDSWIHSLYRECDTCPCVRSLEDYFRERSFGNSSSVFCFNAMILSVELKWDITKLDSIIPPTKSIHICITETDRKGRKSKEKERTFLFSH